MTSHIDVQKQSPALLKKFVKFSTACKQCTLEESLVDLVAIRASQINACAFCVDMRGKGAAMCPLGNPSRPQPSIPHAPSLRQNLSTSLPCKAFSEVRSPNVPR